MDINIHRFFCTKCGKEGIMLPRKRGHERERMHKKKLYCIFCKDEINHIECKNSVEVLEFKENFKEGVYNV